MKRRLCIILSSIHLLALAVCTYLAAVEIESILGTGLICSATGVAAGISAIAIKRPILAAAGFLTPLIATILFVLEVFVLHLGPGRAALPFCIVFIVNQVFATLTILTQLRIVTSPPGARAKQITIKTLLLLIASFSVFFAVARQLLQREHDWLMALSLGLIGLTFVGLAVVLHTAMRHRNTTQTAT